MTRRKPAKACFTRFATRAAERPGEFSAEAPTQTRISLLDTLASMTDGASLDILFRGRLFLFQQC